MNTPSEQDKSRKCILVVAEMPKNEHDPEQWQKWGNFLRNVIPAKPLTGKAVWKRLTENVWLSESENGVLDVPHFLVQADSFHVKCFVYNLTEAPEIFP